MHYSRKLEYTFFLCLGLLISFALNQHLVGKAAVFTCDAVVPRQNNFVFEVLLLAILTMIVFSLFYLKNVLSPFVMVTIIALIVGLLFLQNYIAGSAFKADKSGWKVEKVWSDESDTPPPPALHKKWKPSKPSKPSKGSKHHV